MVLARLIQIRMPVRCEKALRYCWHVTWYGVHRRNDISAIDGVDGRHSESGLSASRTSLAPRALFIDVDEIVYGVLCMSYLSLNEGTKDVFLAA